MIVVLQTPCISLAILVCFDCCSSKTYASLVILVVHYCFSSTTICFNYFSSSYWFPETFLSKCPEADIRTSLRKSLKQYFRIPVWESLMEALREHPMSYRRASLGKAPRENMFFMCYSCTFYNVWFNTKLFYLWLLYLLITFVQIPFVSLVSLVSFDYFHQQTFCFNYYAFNSGFWRAFWSSPPS